MLSLVIPQLSAAAAPRTDTFCGYISQYMPSECNCIDAKYGFTADCEVNFLEIDTIGVKATVLPCGSPAQAKLDVYEKKLGIDCKLAGISAGKTYSIPIPGLSFDIPELGSVGVMADVKLGGNPSALEIQFGLDGCGTVLSHSLCGSKLTHLLPIWLLDGTFDFSDVCNGVGSPDDASKGAALSVDSPHISCSMERYGVINSTSHRPLLAN